MKWRKIQKPLEINKNVLLLCEGEAIQGCWTGTDWSYITLRSHGCGCCAEENPPPTHWAPLPTLPKAA